DDVAITELSFSREYTAAVEAKQPRGGLEQGSVVRTGPGIETCPCVNLNPPHLGEALSKNPGYIKLRKIRAAQNISKTIATSQNRIYLTADNLVLNLQDESFT
ncbi:PHB2 isoform 10, partial [Pongo abelii]